MLNSRQTNEKKNSNFNKNLIRNNQLHVILLYIYIDIYIYIVLVYFCLSKQYYYILITNKHMNRKL